MLLRFAICLNTQFKLFKSFDEVYSYKQPNLLAKSCPYCLYITRFSALSILLPTIIT